MWIMDFLVINDNIFIVIQLGVSRNVRLHPSCSKVTRFVINIKKNYTDWIEIRIKMTLRVVAHIRFAGSEEIEGQMDVRNSTAIQISCMA